MAQPCWRTFIRIAGMTHVKTVPYYPQSNGKIKRWHKTLKGDCIRVETPLDLDDARRLVTDYVAHYNTVRLHSAIGYVTPQDRLAGRHLEIFAARDRKLAEARQRRQQQRQAEHQRRHCQPTVSARPAIDFVAVRAAVSLAAVLDLLGCSDTRRGDQQRGPCPLHGSTAGTSRCFSANLAEHTFHCFKCGRSGNALDLWTHATQQLPYDATVDLCQRLGIALPMLASSRHREEEPVALPTKGGNACDVNCYSILYSLTYLENNQSRIDYPRYRELGLPVGSGQVEAQCKTLVGARCKQAGMRNWTYAGAEAVLRLRAAKTARSMLGTGVAPGGVKIRHNLADAPIAVRDSGFSLRRSHFGIMVGWQSRTWSISCGTPSAGLERLTCSSEAGHCRAAYWRGRGRPCTRVNPLPAVAAADGIVAP